MSDRDGHGGVTDTRIQRGGSEARWPRGGSVIRARVALLIAVCALIFPGAAHASRGCGSLRSAHAFFRVVIVHGSASCGEARNVLQRFMAGAGVEHGGPYAYQQYWSLGAWRCGHGAGGSGCSRGRSLIQALWVADECGHKPAGATAPCRRR